MTTAFSNDQGLLGSNVSDQGEALDLILGHLTTTTLFKDSYDNLEWLPDLHLTTTHRNVTRSMPGTDDPVNWIVCNDGVDHSKDEQIVASIQPFQSGGYEVSVIKQDLKNIAYLQDLPRATGPRIKGDFTDVESSIRRAKKKARHLIKSIGCDRLLTLTRRESNPENFWTLEQWKSAWARFVLTTKRAGYPIEYVGVFEFHKKGNYHLHAAIKGYLPINIIRGIWWSVVGGRGAGNVDIAFKPGISAHKRRAGLAKYVSKYITKQADLVEFNKKRYFASRHKLPKSKKIILKASDPYEALAELASILGLDINALFKDAYIPESSTRLVVWFMFDAHLLSNNQPSENRHG